MQSGNEGAAPSVLQLMDGCLTASPIGSTVRMQRARVMASLGMPAPAAPASALLQQRHRPEAALMVARSELANLKPERAVYERRGAVLFLSTRDAAARHVEEAMVKHKAAGDVKIKT